jgi:hypothetical protein
MGYSYCLDIDEIEDDVIDELYVLAAKQARISTRRRRYMFDIRLSAYSLTVYFEHKRDHDDFEDAFGDANAEFLTRHSFVEAEPAPAFDWDGYVDRHANPSQRQ